MLQPTAHNCPQALSCLRGKTIAFVGDSQLRTLFDGMRNLLSGTEAPIVKYVGFYKGYVTDGVRMAYYWDPHVDR